MASGAEAVLVCWPVVRTYGASRTSFDRLVEVRWSKGGLLANLAVSLGIDHDDFLVYGELAFRSSGWSNTRAQQGAAVRCRLWGGPRTIQQCFVY